MKHISESIIGRKGREPAKVYFIEFGGLNPKLLKKYASGKISYTDLTSGFIPEETTYTDPDQFSEQEVLSAAQMFINRKYRFPSMVYARVMDRYKEVIDTVYGKTFSADLSRYSSIH